MAGESLSRTVGKNVRVAFTKEGIASWTGILSTIEDAGVTVTKGVDARFIPFSNIVCIYLSPAGAGANEDEA